MRANGFDPKPVHRQVRVSHSGGKWEVFVPNGRVFTFSSKAEAIKKARENAERLFATLVIEGKDYPVYHASPGKGRFSIEEIEAAVDAVISRRGR